MTLESKRKDRRGHWPRGKRRNPDRGNWSRVRLLLAQLLDEHGTIGSTIGPAGRVSRRELARVLGVQVKSVCKWVDGITRPAPEYQQAVSQWVTEKQRQINRAQRNRNP